MSQLATKTSDLRSIITSDKMKQQFAAALPHHLTPDRFCRIALTALTRTPKLADCTQESLMRCLLDLSAYGIEPDGRRAHLIPYKKNWKDDSGKWQSCMEVQLILDWKGIAELAMRSGIIAKLHADIVCENDVFEYNLGEVVQHKIDFKSPRGAMYAAYAMAVTKDGPVFVAVLNKDEIDSVRKRSKSSDNGPWVTDYNEMAKKGLALDTPIPTPQGWSTMGDLKVGDTVFSMNGAMASVIAVSEIKHIDCYRVVFANGDSIVCDAEHLWVSSIGTNGAANRKRNGWRTHGIDKLFAAKHAGEIVSVPVTGSIDCPHAKLPISPWLLGYWLGNGCKNQARVTCHSEDANEVAIKITESGFALGTQSPDKRSKAVSIGVKGGFLEVLRANGILRNKHVPAIYLRSSIAQRRELLRGLMDSDGHIEKRRGRAMFGSTDKCLADAVAELASSLGEVVNCHSSLTTGYGKTVMSHVVSWQPVIAPVSLSRRLLSFRPRKLALYRGVKSITKISSVPTRCIAVDADSKTYLAGRTMIPTHNTAFRRLAKWLPLSAEFRDAVDKDDDLPPEKDVTPKVARAVPLNPFASEAEPAAIEETTVVDVETAPDVTEPDPMDDSLLTDLLTAVNDCEDPAMLTKCVHQSNEDFTGAKQTIAKRAIETRAKVLGVKWVGSKEKGGFQAA